MSGQARTDVRIEYPELCRIHRSPIDTHDFSAAKMMVFMVLSIVMGFYLHINSQEPSEKENLHWVLLFA